MSTPILVRLTSRIGDRDEPHWFNFTQVTELYPTVLHGRHGTMIIVGGVNRFVTERVEEVLTLLNDTVRQLDQGATNEQY